MQFTLKTNHRDAAPRQAFNEHQKEQNMPKGSSVAKGQPYRLIQKEIASKHVVSGRILLLFLYDAGI